MKTNTWQLQEAKSKFSQLVENALNDTPQIVTKHGNKAVVILSYEKYKTMSKPKIGLVEFLSESPLAKAELELTRNKDIPRDLIL